MGRTVIPMADLRSSVLRVVAREPWICTCDLSWRLDQPQSVVEHCLGQLLAEGKVETRDVMHQWDERTPAIGSPGMRRWRVAA